VLFWSPPLEDDRDTHAGHTETSVMLAIAPECVDTDRFELGLQVPIGELLPQLRASGVLGVSPNGILGDPRTANAADGHRFLTAWSASLRLAVETWRTS
jgi:creatinine amidohydrolase